MSKDITIRQAMSADVPQLVRLRRTMFEAMGSGNPVQLDAADAATTAYFARAIPAGHFHGWLAATLAGVAVGSGGIVMEQGIRCVALHATQIGRPLYEELGFEDSNEMQLRWG